MNTDIIEKVLYEQTFEEAEAFLSSCDDSAVLHVFAYNHNWSDGFDLPRVVIDNPACSLSTALTVFYLADGYTYLTEKDEAEDIPEWQDFITYLYQRILDGKFVERDIAFNLPLSKVQVFKLKKQLNEKEQVFVTPIEGEDLDLMI